jgi:LacI family transcriptional regulator
VPRVAVCIDTREGPARERLAGVYRYATQRKWQLSLVRHEDDLHLRLLRGGRFDGAITFDRSEALQRMLHGQGVPCIEASATNLALSHGAVFVDDDAIGREAVEHLAAAGFERFAYCGLAGSTVSRLRGESLVRHAASRRNAALIFDDRHADGLAALEPMARWLKQAERPVGVLAFDDRMAMRVMTACRLADLRVPDEVAVLGIGNDELLCELMEPTLSSVAVPTREVGRRAAEMLGALLQGRTPAKRHIALPPLDVVARASTDRLATEDVLTTRAAEHLRSNAHKPVGTDQVADALGVARRTLERRFHDATGQTLHQYLTDLRLRRAKQSLRQSDRALVEIAQECGYSALSAFIRMFEHATGYHPRDYRRAHWGR